MPRDVERKARLAHAGARAHDDEVGAVEAGDRVIELADARRDAAVQVLVRRIQPVEPLEGLEKHLVEPLQALMLLPRRMSKMRCSAESSSSAVSPAPLGRVVQNAARRLNQHAHVELVAHDHAVFLDIRDARHELGELHQVHLAGAFVKCIFLTEPLEQRDEVYRLARREHFEHHTVDQAVVDLIEILGARQKPATVERQDGSSKTAPRTDCSASALNGSTMPGTAAVFSSKAPSAMRTAPLFRNVRHRRRAGLKPRSRRRRALR